MDEFYQLERDGCVYSAHKSCIITENNKISNAKYLKESNGLDMLKERCKIIDNIEENLNVHIHRYTVCASRCDDVNTKVILYLDNSIAFEYCGEYINTYNTYDKLYEFISKNYPNLLKNQDIKIALK